ncbi:MAG: LLM class flavin-dependent oxidoreductase [Acidimicrobiia bacterium]|nr:LLM class flavin-dependent oxidoreductase [Acidimicrobiia bacterium]
MELALQTSGNLETLKRAAAWAEARGMAALAPPDHYYPPSGGPMFDALVQLGDVAAVTRSIELVLLVGSITFRHPAVIAKSDAPLDEMAPGRFALGLGTGWLETEHDVLGLSFPNQRERFDLLEERLQYVRAALADHERGFEGMHYRLDDVLLRPPAPGVRLIVGGTGPRRTPGLAGRYADEFNAYPGPDLGDRITRMRATAELAGRDPHDIRVSSAGAVFCAPDVASYEEKLRKAASEASLTVDQLEGDFDTRNTPRSPADTVRAELFAMKDAGASRLYVQTFDNFDIERETETLELLGVG